MSDYIEREAVQSAVWEEDNQTDMILAIGSLPAADVASVRHGRWIPSDYTGDCCYTCSECGFERDAYLLDVGNYCPACGARMSGKEDKDETTK